MEYSLSELAMVLAPAALLVLVAVRMIWTRYYARFPVFFTYTLFHIVSITVTLASSRMRHMVYFYTYWTFAVIDIFMCLAVIQELYRHAFAPFETLRGLSGLIFRWATLMLCGICILTAAFSPGRDTFPVMSALLVLLRSSFFVNTALLALLFTLSAFFGVKWQKAPFSIAVGLGVMSALAAIAVAVRTQLGELAHPMLGMMARYSYNLACGIWVYGVLARERNVTLADQDRRQLTEWDRALQEIAER